MISAALAIGSYHRFDANRAMQETYCETTTNLYHQDDSPACTIQAFVLQLSLLALAAFFASSGFDLFLKIVLAVEIRPNTQYDYLLSLAYYFWGWTVPLTLAVVAAATKSLGPSDDALFFCFIHGRENATVPWATLYLPFIIQLFVGMISLSATVVQLVRLKRRADDQSYKSALKGTVDAMHVSKWNFTQFFVPLALEIFFFMYLLFILLFRAAVWFSSDAWDANIEKYLECLTVSNPLTSHIRSILPDSKIAVAECGLKPETIKVGVWFFFQALIPVIGFVVYVIVGSQKVYYQLWSAVIGYYFSLPDLLVWAATTNQAKIYAKRLADARRRRLAAVGVGPENKPALEPSQQEVVDTNQQIVDQVKQQAQLIKEQERQAMEEKQRAQREKQEQMLAANLNMIAPHLRPMYWLSRRPRKMLPSLADILNNPSNAIGPKPAQIVDIYAIFSINDGAPVQSPREDFFEYDEYDY